jgi:molybdate transport repressor ModE-like protein
MFDLRQFEVLRAIRDEGSLAKAARTLSLSQPSVLYHLNALERHLGAQLVQRTPRGSSLTPLGEMFAKDCDEALAKLDEAKQRVDQHRRFGAPTLRIGTFVTAGARVLPKILRTLQRRTSGEIRLTEGNPWEVLEALQDRRIDAALIYDLQDEHVFWAPGVKLTPLWHEEFRIVLSSERLAACNGRTDFAALAGTSWIRSPHPDEPSGRALTRLSRETGIATETKIIADDYALVFALVREGLAAAVVAEPAISGADGLSIFPLDQAVGTRTVSFATLEDDHRRNGLVDELEALLLLETGAPA